MNYIGLNSQFVMKIPRLKSADTEAYTHISFYKIYMMQFVKSFISYSCQHLHFSNDMEYQKLKKNLRERKVMEKVLKVLDEDILCTRFKNFTYNIPTVAALYEGK